MDSVEGTDSQPKPAKSSKLILISVVLLLLGIIGGFASTYLGLINPAGHEDEHAADIEVDGQEPFPELEFVELDPLIITLGTLDSPRHLRFKANLQIKLGEKQNVVKLMPRIMDLLNGYLRAIDTEDLQSATGLIRVRSQMLRRVQLITGDDRVTDLLISEFILS